MGLETTPLLYMNIHCHRVACLTCLVGLGQSSPEEIFRDKVQHTKTVPALHVKFHICDCLAATCGNANAGGR